VVRRSGILRAATGALAAATIIVSLLASTGALTALSCCAATHGKCARLKAPDDCCRTMGHIVSVADALLPSHDVHTIGTSAAFAAVVPHAFAHPLTIQPSSIASRHAFKRPHGPPRPLSTPLLI